MKPEPISVDAPNQSDETTEVAAASASYVRQPVQIGPYKIIKVIGRGGMGTVYKAQVVVSCEVPIGQEVAIKLLRETEEKERQRFAREAGYLQALHHPGIVRVLDAGEYEGQPYLVMQLVDGGHADDLLLAGKVIDQHKIADLAIQALEALQVAHLHGILHRDIKPGNIMITGAGQVKLVDFGLAQYMDAESHLTATGAVVGTPAYMSPEQAAGRRTEVGRRSDLYSMGACLYELLTGQQPFIADNSVALLRRIIEEPLVPPSRLRPDLQHDLETIVLKAMAKDFRDRYPSAEAMAADLRRFRLGVRVRTARPGALLPLLRTAWHHRSTIAALGLLLFVSASLATLMVVQGLKHAKAQGTAVNTQTAREEKAEKPPESESAPSNPWVADYSQSEALDDPASRLKLKPAPTLGKNAMRTDTIKRVNGSVRLGVNVKLRGDSCLVELMVSDRDIGRGYRLRLVGSKDSDRLELMREKRVLTSRDVGPLPRDRVLRLTIERNEDLIIGSIGELPPLRFPDLVPIEGEKASGVYIAYVPAEARVSDIQLDRQRSTLFISALEIADNERYSSDFAIAKDMYEQFLRDHPKSPQARDAQLRIGLCLEAMDNPLAYEQALNTFIEVASTNRDDPRYVLTATVHAWSCALCLGRYQEAEEFFDAVRRDNDLTTVLATVSEAMVQDLVKDYLTRARTIAAAEPERALKLFSNGAEIAAYLNQDEAAAEAVTDAGDILMSLERSTQALERYRGVGNNMKLPLPLRLKALLKVGEAERMRDHLEAAESAYSLIIASPVPVEDFQARARLWLGDIYAQRNDLAGAQECWGKSTDEKSLPGIIMHRLISADTPMPVGDDRFQANDIEYFNARLALIRGHPEQFLERLQHVAEMGPANDWPTPFARHLLEVLQSGRSEADVEKHPADTDKRPAGTLSEAPEGSAKAPASP